MVQGSETDQDFDALVVCNGHYSDPRVPDLPGCSEFPGQVLHTHNFRENGPFEGLRVVIMGASASGQDIAREIADVANTVSLNFPRFPAKITLHATVLDGLVNLN